MRICLTDAPTETPIDQFKRATINTVRALCERDDVTGGVYGGAVGGDRNRAKVPLPQREMDPFALDVLRGMADGAVLRLKHHNVHAFQASLPLQPEAAKAFTALEDARIEALGARDMLGVAHNLETALENRYRQEGYARFTKREEMPMAEALRLLTREAYWRSAAAYRPCFAGVMAAAAFGQARKIPAQASQGGRGSAALCPPCLRPAAPD